MHLQRAHAIRPYSCTAEREREREREDVTPRRGAGAVTVVLASGGARGRGRVRGRERRASGFQLWVGGESGRARGSAGLRYEGADVWMGTCETG